MKLRIMKIESPSEYRAIHQDEVKGRKTKNGHANIYSRHCFADEGGLFI